MNNIKCLYALSSMCRGTEAQCGHTLCLFSQPVNSFNANCFLHPEVLHLSITSGPAFQQTPPVIKNQIRLLPQKCPVTGIHVNSPCVQGGA